MRERSDRVEPTFGASDPLDDAALSDRPTGARRHRPERPLLISVFAALMFIGGGALLFIPLLTLPQLKSAFDAVGISAFSALAQMSAIGILCMVGSLGVWEGARWGWTVAIVALLFGLATGVQQLLFAFGPAAPFEVLDRPTISLQTRALLKILLHVAAIGYFFMPSVRRYFALTMTAVVKRFGVILVVVALLLVGLLYSSTGRA